MQEEFNRYFLKALSKNRYFRHVSESRYDYFDDFSRIDWLIEIAYYVEDDIEVKHFWINDDFIYYAASHLNTEPSNIIALANNIVYDLLEAPQDMVVS
jgi:hypothetical protein